MVSFEDDDDNDAVSQESGSNIDDDENMEDVDNGDQDADGDGDPDGDGDEDGDGDDGDNDDEEGDNNEDDDEQDEPESPSQSASRRPSRNVTTGHSPLPNGVSTSSRSLPNGVGPAGASQPTVRFSSPSPRPSASTQASLPFRPSIRLEALTAPVYDIVPTIAAPHATSINAVTATPDMRWVFTGGTDGYLRKFNWPDTVNSKLMLTVAQRHPFVESVTKAGVLLSYWDNEDTTLRTPSSSGSLGLSPVYSLAVHNQGLWLLSGAESGGINLYAVRHDEGKRITCLRKHTSAVSVLNLAPDEKTVLSGSWDKNIHDWDLNTGQVKRSFDGSAGQISAIEPRPLSSLPVPQQSETEAIINGTLSSNNGARPRPNGVLPNGVGTLNGTLDASQETGNEDAAGSPDNDSLFGDNGSLFGDAPNGTTEGGQEPGFAEDDDNEFSRMIASEMQQQDETEVQADVDMTDAGGPVQPPDAPSEPTGTAAVETNGIVNHGDAQDSTATNGLPHAADEPMMNGAGHSEAAPEAPPSSETTFLDASIHGTLRIWDRRQPNPIAHIRPHRGIPPWCMGACWSPDGNFIYAGRRNGTVDEYSLHKGFYEPRRIFKFPAGSGAVSAVRVMPNGKHLVCASHDILRLYDLKDQQASRHSAVPFLIVPGHRTGVISHLYFDPTYSYMISTAGNRGWEGNSTEVLLGYEIGIPKSA